ncbi:MAG: hypothetical protein EPN48_11140 [Microbacteriaceae bacterium]|nr:MAG: hypothetical protein EPN48_11140 [Microbacteriaceae bacterium]
MRHQKYGDLNVMIASTDEELGRTAAEDLAAAVKTALHAQKEIAIIMALGAAQDAFFSAIRDRDDIEWSRITVLHVDTYMGVPEDVPESGAYRMRKHLLDYVKPKAFLPMHGDHVPVEEELVRYSQIVEELNPVLSVVGIGDSGHLAFNDPPADFATKDLVRVVALGEITLNQIAKIGLFPSVKDIPRYGISLTMYALLRPQTVLALVHDADKAPVIKELLEGPVTMMCPASLLQRQSHARLYLNEDAAALLGSQA